MVYDLQRDVTGAGNLIGFSLLSIGTVTDLFEILTCECEGIGCFFLAGH